MPLTTTSKFTRCSLSHPLLGQKSQMKDIFYQLTFLWQVFLWLALSRQSWGDLTERSSWLLMQSPGFKSSWCWQVCLSYYLHRKRIQNASLVSILGNSGDKIIDLPCYIFWLGGGGKKSILVLDSTTPGFGVQKGKQEVKLADHRVLATKSHRELLAVSQIPKYTCALPCQADSFRLSTGRRSVCPVIQLDRPQMYSFPHCDSGINIASGQGVYAGRCVSICAIGTLPSAGHLPKKVAWLCCVCVWEATMMSHMLLVLFCFVLDMLVVVCA